MEHEEVGTSPSISATPVIKITIVGDSLVGKTCMLKAYTEKKYPEESSTILYENYGDDLKVDGHTFIMTLWDAAEQEDYERLRSLFYPHVRNTVFTRNNTLRAKEVGLYIRQTRCFLLCFSIVSRSSFDNVTNKWAPEVRHHCPNVPIVLVGTKTDLRQDKNPDHLSTNDGMKLKRTIKAAAYVECSAKEMMGLENVFVTGIRAATSKGSISRMMPCSFL